MRQDVFLLTTFVFLSYVHFSKKLCINLCINLKLCEESATCKDKPEELKQKKHIYTAWKVSKYGVISSPYFPVFGLNTEIYEVNLRIQSEYRKIRTRNNSVFGYFSRSDTSRKAINSKPVVVKENFNISVGLKWSEKEKYEMKWRKGTFVANDKICANVELHTQSHKRFQPMLVCIPIVEVYPKYLPP